VLLAAPVANDSVNYLGGDVGIDAAKRWNNTTGFTTRIGGAAQALGGLANRRMPRAPT
jgi:hypothetical protein